MLASGLAETAGGWAAVEKGMEETLAEQAARLLRRGRLVRLFRLAGSAPRPEMFEMDDVVPATFAAIA